MLLPSSSFVFSYTSTAATEISALSLHDALSDLKGVLAGGLTALAISLTLGRLTADLLETNLGAQAAIDRKSTRLNSSHGYISYAVFCLKKKTTGAPNGDPRVAPAPAPRRVRAGT